MTIYNYILSTDFSNGIDPSCLDKTIIEFNFSNQFNGITVNYDLDLVDIDFTGNLAPSDESDLNTIVSNHNPDTCEEESDVGTVIGVAGDAQSNDISSTTSKSPQRKLRMSISDLPEGRYRIGWYYEFAHSSSSQDFRARVQLDDSIDLMEHLQELKDAGTDQSNMGCGFSYQDLIAGDHTIDLDYWAENGTAYIKNAKLEIWRVG